MPVYIIKAANSDCAGGADFDKVISAGTEGAGSITVAVAAGATEDSFVYTLSGIPNSDAWEETAHTVEVNVTTAQMKIFLSIAVRRINSACTEQEIGAFTAEQELSLVQVFTFSPAGVAWAGEVCGDRISYVYRFRNSNTMNVGTVVIETGTVDTEHTSPITEDAGTCAGQTVVIGQGLETDLSQIVAWAPKNRLVGQTVEVDTAQPITIPEQPSDFVFRVVRTAIPWRI